jgi:surface protein
MASSDAGSTIISTRTRSGLAVRSRWSVVAAAAVVSAVFAIGSAPATAGSHLVTGVDGQPIVLEFVAANNHDRAYVLLGRTDENGSETVDVSVDWGDGTPLENHTTTGIKPHTYASAGTYTVKIWPRFADRGGSDTGPWLTIYGGNRGDGSWYFTDLGNEPAGEATDLARLTRVVSLGELGTTSLRNAFNRHRHLVAVPVTLPSTVTDVGYMFRYATTLNDANISAWNMVNVTSTRGMFAGAADFNRPLAGWNVANVTETREMFRDATAFNQSLAAWNVANVTTMRRMFYGATAFNQPLATWNVSSVTVMEEMFRDATAFNQPLAAWNVSSVTDMRRMFQGATAFDQPLGAWNVSNVTQMNRMFQGATKFNQPLAAWNVAEVTGLQRTFEGATAFDQDLGDWRLNADADLESMLDGSGLSVACYDATLIGWAALAPPVTGRFFGADGLVRSSASDAARALLTGAEPDGRGWTINGDSTGGTVAGPCVEPVVTSTPTPVSGPSLACLPAVLAVGDRVTCTVSDADAGIEILWRAAYNPVFASAGVRIGADGRGTFTFVVPAVAVGQEVRVELVEWTTPLSLGVVGRPVPGSVPAGEGTVGLLAATRWPIAAFVAVAVAIASALVLPDRDVGSTARRLRRGLPTV